MKQFSNTYIFLFAAIMVVVVAAVLSITATLLQPRQDKNEEVAKMQRILSSIHINSTAETAQSLFDENISRMEAVNVKGEPVEGVDPFEIDMKVVMRKEFDDRIVPVFVAEKENSGNLYIFPLEGKGLWGPIYGYIAIQDDGNTVYGATFDHV